MSVYRNHPGAYELDNAPNPLTGEKWGGYYCRHVGALTEEDMHSKAEIAAELAHRDLQIDNLRAELAACKADAERYRWLRNPRGWPAVFSGAEEPEPVTGETLDSMVDYVRKGEV